MVDITINETIDLVDITVNPNIIEVNVTRTSGGGGSQTLAQTLDLGNQTGGENILVNNADAIELENTSSLQKGTYNFGGNGGISRICSNNYEDMWQNGFRHVFDQSGVIRNSSNGFDFVPDSSFDVTLRFKVGSFWTLDNGTTYICTDNTEGAAEWELYSVGATPTLQEVTDKGNTTDNDIIVRHSTDNEIIISSITDSSQISVNQGTASISMASQENAGVTEALIQMTSDKGYNLITEGAIQLSNSENNTTIDLNDSGLSMVTLGVNQRINLSNGVDDVSIKTDLITEAGLEQQLPNKSGTFAMLSDISSGAVDSVNGQTGVVVLDADDIDDTSTTNKFTTAADISKLAGIEANADVTDSTNVNAAGAVMNSDYSSHSILVQQSGSGSPTSLGIANNTLVGRLSGGGSNINDLSVSDVKGLLDFTTPTDVQTIADGKVSDAIVDGVTTVAPSQNAVFDALALKLNKNKYIRQNLTTVTGVTGATVICSILIPANTYESGEGFEIVAGLRKSLTAASVAFRIYHDTTLNGISNNISTGQSLSSAANAATTSRLLYINGTTLRNSINSAVNSLSPYDSFPTTTASTSTFNPAVDNYITITANPTLITEVVGVNFVSIRPL
jgi:hypothetical protein